MNAKLLFAATVIVSAIASLASTAALADEGKAPLTRAQVVEQLNVARANGTLQRTDYDDDQALVARRAAEHDNASPILARLFRGKAG